MDEKYIKQRIAKLRTDNNISARELSQRLGQSTGYINTIENGKSLPSMTMFLAICDYFGITPSDFFDKENEYPDVIKEIVEECKGLDRSALESILNLIKNMKK
ncbi:MAG: helix-turn-helix transcriptional regulator [Clostridia bacterium]|nr:helix-turn-helix transcriptional regulator [Clostridia bacterium]